MCSGRVFIVAAAILWFGSQPVQAQSPQSLPGVNLGFTSFLDGAPPAGPGLYFQQYVQSYNANRLMDKNGNPLALPDPRLDVWVTITQFIYMWDKKIDVLEDAFGISARPALDFVIPTVTPDLDFSAPAPLTANRGGLGDILIGPALQFDPVMGANGPLYVSRIEAQMILPTGLYSSSNVINPGSNFFSFDPYWAGTIFLSPKTTFSHRLHYLWNAENHSPADILGPNVTTTQAGQAFHMNFAAEHEIIDKKLRVGLNGYYLKQTTDALVNGTAVAGTQEQVLGIGPGAIYSFSQTNHVLCNLYWETDAVNRPEGFRMTLRYVHKF